MRGKGKTTRLLLLPLLLLALAVPGWGQIPMENVR